MLIFHGCIAILKNSNCKPSPFKPLKLNCVERVRCLDDKSMWLIFQRSCWLVLLHQKYEDVMKNSSNSPLKNGWKKPFQVLWRYWISAVVSWSAPVVIVVTEVCTCLDRFFQWRCLSWKLVILHPSCPGKFVVHGDFFILQSIFPTKFNSEWKPLESYKRAPRGRKGSSSNGELLNFGGVYEQTFSGPCIKEILGWYFEMVGLSISM